MRILQGEWQGRSIPFPRGISARPLTEKAREALFHILTHHWGSLTGCQAIDLFAGCGTVGLEFLSRGAAYITFVEKEALAARSLHTLLQAWGAAHRSRVLLMQVETFLQQPAEPADFIFAGPPFRYWRKKILISLILERGWLNPGGCFILEHPLYESYEEMPYFWRVAQYVSSKLSFFRL